MRRRGEVCAVIAVLAIGGVCNLIWKPLWSQAVLIPIRISSANFEPDPGSGIPAGAVLVTQHDEAGALVSETVIPAAEPIRSGRVFAREQESVKTGIAILNANNNETLVSFYYTDASGTDFGHGGFTLGPHQQLAAFLAEAPFDASPKGDATFSFDATHPVSVVALRGLKNGNGEFAWTALPVTSLAGSHDASAKILPFLVDGSDWSNEVVLTNPSDLPLTGTLEFLGIEKQPPIQYAIAPRSSFHTVTGTGPNAMKAGWARITPSEGTVAPDGVAILSRSNGRNSVSEASVTLDSAATDFEMYIESRGETEKPGAVRSSVIIVNTSAGPTTVKVAAADLAGTVYESTLIDLPAKTQVIRFVNDVLQGLPSEFRGSLRIVSSSPVAVSGLRYRYIGGDDVLITAAPKVIESVNREPTGLFFPHVVNGGGYSTEFLIFDRSVETTLSGQIVYRSQEGLLEPEPPSGAAVSAPTTDSKILSSYAAEVTSPYFYNFNQDGVLQESGNISESTSPYWWVNSGAYLNASQGRGWTVQGTLPHSDRWRQIYARNNPVDTENGYRPQNIFRLTTRSLWQNERQEAYFVITADNLTDSANRNGSNGLLLFNRYLDGNNLYYIGVRVDGAAVIKKKLNGSYYTLAYTSGIYPGRYDRNSNPNLLPKNKWIGLRSEVVNISDGAVSIRLYIDKGWQGVWSLVAEAVDDGKKFGTAITEPGLAGIRTDFMDVMFENFRLRTLD